MTTLIPDNDTETQLAKNYLDLWVRAHQPAIDLTHKTAVGLYLGGGRWELMNMSYAYDGPVAVGMFIDPAPAIGEIWIDWDGETMTPKHHITA